MSWMTSPAGRRFGAIVIVLALLIGVPAVADAQDPATAPTAWLAEDDSDGDGVPDVQDNCQFAANADQADADGDGIGDACDEAPPPDADADQVPDEVDNCPTLWNPGQEDIDGDGLGDSCDENPHGPPADGGGGDGDGDGYTDSFDNCPSAPNADQADVDEDGIGTACDTLERPRAATDCTKDGWTAFNGRYSFTSRHDCVQHVAHGKASPHRA